MEAIVAVSSNNIEEINDHLAMAKGSDGCAHIMSACVCAEPPIDFETKLTEMRLLSSLWALKGSLNILLYIFINS